jgi:hypothetical protein
MTRELAFLSHPISGNILRNLESVCDWLSFLRRRSHNVTIIAPYLGPLWIGLEDDSDPIVREFGLVDCETTVAHCNGIIMTSSPWALGPTNGMHRELDAALDGNAWVSDLTEFCEPESCLLSPIEYGRTVWDARVAARQNNVGRMR